MKLDHQQYFAILVLLIQLFVGCDRSHHRSTEQITGATMGTTYQVKYLPGSSTPKLVDISKLIDDELLLVNLQMSTYQDDSELFRFNSTMSTDWQQMSKQTVEVIEIGLQYYELSHGAFDITVGPLVNLWGFGPDPEPTRIPKEAEVRKLLEAVGSDKLAVRLDPPSLKKSNANIKVDLSAIAKGHAVDRVAMLLEQHGVEHYFVEIGGEVRVAGKRLDGEPWQVGIEQPNPRGRELHRVVDLSNGAMATSGNYRNFYKLEGKRLSHFIDPRTGMPIDSKLLSATVIMDDCASADAAATTLMVVGSEEAQTLIQRQQWAAMLIIENEGKLETITSAQFEQRVNCNLPLSR